MLVHNARSFLEMLVSIYIDSLVHLQYITIHGLQLPPQLLAWSD